jgi:hypothetical protein
MARPHVDRNGIVRRYRYTDPGCPTVHLCAILREKANACPCSGFEPLL